MRNLFAGLSGLLVFWVSDAYVGTQAGYAIQDHVAGDANDPVFAYQDISFTGTPIPNAQWAPNSDDGFAGPFDLGFLFVAAIAVRGRSSAR